MSGIADQQYLLNKQYRNSSNLQARIDLHARFSTNTYGWFRWIVDHLQLPSQAYVLELGCGPGLLWRENLGRIPAGWDITLSDFSPGMLQQARDNLRDAGRPFTFAVVDAQDIPFADDSFDAVIANHMLYHVPDRPRAFAEIRRVLRPNGRLYATTNGEAHLQELEALLPKDEFDFSHAPFDLENGRAQLAPWFPTITLHRYDDALVVTETEPLIAYLLSMRAASGLSDAERTAVTERVERELAARGVIRITKDSGLFEAWAETPGTFA